MFNKKLLFKKFAVLGVTMLVPAIYAHQLWLQQIAILISILLLRK